jgi:hydrogenase maturation protease
MTAKPTMQPSIQASQPIKNERRDATLVLGLGNILQQDDGLGVRAAELLAERLLPPNVCVREAGTPGIGLVSQIEGWSRVYLIDAAQMNQEPGVWRRFGTDDVKLSVQDDILSLHEPDVAGALALAEAVKILPEEVIIYAVEPQQVGWGEQLSPCVQASLPGLVDQITDELWKRQG